METNLFQQEPKKVLAKRSLQVSVLLWIACIAAIFPLSHGKLPFDRPVLAGASLLAQVILQAISPLPPLVLMGVTYLLTRRRILPDMSSRAPAVSAALRETLMMWLYGACVLGVGQLFGHRLFGEGIGLHLNGSLFGPTCKTTRW